MDQKCLLRKIRVDLLDKLLATSKASTVTIHCRRKLTTLVTRRRRPVLRTTTRTSTPARAWVQPLPPSVVTNQPCPPRATVKLQRPRPVEDREVSGLVGQGVADGGVVERRDDSGEIPNILFYPYFAGYFPDVFE